MGERGPVPQRTALRRRRNAPDPSEPGLVTAAIGSVEIPEPDEDWHSVAYNWFVGLEASGQSKFYAQSDWDLAYLLAENISRLLKPVFVGMAEVWNSEAQAMERRPVMQRMPIKGGELSALLKGMGELLVTEGSRRRVRVELSAGDDGPAPVPASVTAISDARSRLGKKGAAS